MSLSYKIQEEWLSYFLFSFAVLNGEGLVTKDTAGKFLLASGQQLL